MARHSNGRWAAGQSGNPGGRPAGLAEVKELARKHTAEGIERSATEMKQGDTSNARIAAANATLGRGWGKPTHPVAGDAEEVPNRRLAKSGARMRAELFARHLGQ